MSQAPEETAAKSVENQQIFAIYDDTAQIHSVCPSQSIEASRVIFKKLLAHGFA
jgi:hypothetical protein